MPIFFTDKRVLPGGYIVLASYQLSAISCQLQLKRAALSSHSFGMKSRGTDPRNKACQHSLDFDGRFFKRLVSCPTYEPKVVRKKQVIFKFAR